MRLTCTLLLGCLLCCLPLFSQIQPPFQEDDPNDLLPLIRQTVATLPELPDSFSPGKTTPLVVSSFMEINHNGFEIQLPSRGLAPSPTIYQGTAYVSGGFGSRQFYAFDALSGETRWAVDLSDDGPSSACLAEEVVVFNTESCTVFALNAETGQPLWSHYLGDPLLSTPTIANGKVFTAYPVREAMLPTNSSQPYQQLQIQDLGATGPASEVKSSAEGGLNLTHALIALDLHSGEILWQHYLDGDIMSAAVADGEEIYLTTFPGTLFRFQQENGELLSARKGKATSAPVPYGNQLLISQRADRGEVREQISQLDARSGNLTKVGYTRSAPYLDEKVQSRSAYAAQAVAYDAGNGFGSGAPATSGWQLASSNIGQASVSSLQNYTGSRILPLGEYHFATMGNELVATHAESGKVAWKKSLPGKLAEAGGHLATPPISVGKEVLICTLSGDILVYKAKNGKLLFQKSVGDEVRSQPVIESGKVYLTTMSGKLLCIDTGHPEWSGWPTWGGNAARSNRAE
jgi:outer membrane protein assembly factor BamB